MITSVVCGVKLSNIVNIGLNASMQSNLLSLQKVSQLVSLTQNRLATGLRVNSAIDNPNSYYTAANLNNQASDLSALLDSMSQGIQTIKAVSEALASAISFLDQANAIANNTLEKINQRPKPTIPIDKSWLVANGVKAENIVTNKAELQARLASAAAGDKIVVMGEIDVGDVELNLKADVQLVGAQKVIDDLGKTNELFVPDKDKGKIIFSGKSSANGIIVGSNSTISDLSLELTTANKLAAQGLINNISNGTVNLKNLDLKMTINGSSTATTGVIMNSGNGSKANLAGIINITSGGTSAANLGIYNIDASTGITQARDSILNIKTSGEYGQGLNGGYNNIYGTVNINTSGTGAAGLIHSSNTIWGTVNITTSGSDGYGIYGGESNILGTVNINTYGQAGRGIMNSKTTISGTVNITTSGASADGVFSGSNSLLSTAKLNINNKNMIYPAFFSTKFTSELGAQIMTIDGIYQCKMALTTMTSFDNSNIPLTPYFVRTGDFNESLMNTKEIKQALAEHSNSEPYTESYEYNSIINQFNTLIKDSSYKGVNLLQLQNLSITFNENRSSGLDINGVDASSKALGIKDADWRTEENIKQSIAELKGAISTLRSYQAEFGNSYTIVQNREEFTQNFINVLTEGSDKLTLADMNQESAYMLALQTRQQLAISSLALASKATQSILKLF